MRQSTTVDVGVWVDYENARHRAAASFGLGGGAPADADVTQPGHFWPLALARRLLARPVTVAAARINSGAPRRRLVRVDAFLGMPDRRQRPGLAWYVERMAQAWSRQGVNVTMLPTWRTPSGTEVEKGIDVSLAMSMQEAALRREVDVVILVSADNDLLPVVYDLHPRRAYRPAIELAAWRGAAGGQAMRAPAGVLTHILDVDDYNQVAAELVRDYGRPAIADPRDRLHPNVATLADRLAEAGLAVKVGAARPVSGGHGDDPPLLRPEGPRIHRVQFGSEGMIPAPAPKHHLIVVQATAGAAALPDFHAPTVPSTFPQPRPSPWWRRVLGALFGSSRESGESLPPQLTAASEPTRGKPADRSQWTSGGLTGGQIS